MIEIIATPAFTDNYIWTLVDRSSQQCVCVDPGDAKPVINFLQQQGLQLTATLITHHHPDHTGGVNALRDYCETPVYGPKNNPLITHPVSEGNQLTSLNHNFLVLAVPGHTLDHLAYYCAPWLFCGDTLFSGGCGRLFEGTPKQMWNSLNKLMELPDNTEVYCTHEYTLSNLAFAQAVDPDNQALQDYLHYCQTKRANDEPTLPSLLGTEKKVNPFLRCNNNQIKGKVEAYTKEKLNSPEQVFAALRAWKDCF